jgi:hypothetical protein
MDIGSYKAVLVMLDDACLSPCYVFSESRPRGSRLALENLRDLLVQASGMEKPPEVFFLASDESPLEPPVRSAIDGLGDNVIVPLLPLDRQESLGIPFSRTQTVTARNLTDLLSKAGDVDGRPVVVHIERQEIPRLRRSLIAIQDLVGSITLRLRDIPHLTADDIAFYESELAMIADIGLMKNATGTGGNLCISNIAMAGLARNRAARCRAGRDFAFLAPDGRIYPCPAFYYDGCERATMAGDCEPDEAVIPKSEPHACRLCGSTDCAGCAFLQRRYCSNENLCNVLKAELSARQNLLFRVAQSGYMFDCLRVLKAKELEERSRQEAGDEHLFRSYVDGVTPNDLICALRDIATFTEAAAESVHALQCQSILHNWSDANGQPQKSQKAIFRRRVMEILEDLVQLAPCGQPANGISLGKTADPDSVLGQPDMHQR